MGGHVIPGCSVMTHRIPIKLQLPGKCRLIFNYVSYVCIAGLAVQVDEECIISTNTYHCTECLELHIEFDFYNI